MTVSSGENAMDSTCSLSRVAPLEAVLFDIDGTLCDSDPIHHYAFREMLLEIGYNGGEPITEEFFIQNIAGKHNEDIATFLFPDDHPRGVKFLEDKEEMFRKLAKEQIKPINGLYKLKKWIEDRGLRRAAVTNAPRLNAEMMVSLLGLSDFFEYVIIGSDCERAKPFPDPYLKALELLKVSKDHTFICEDSVSGITAGVAAGMPVVGCTTRNPEDLLMTAKPTLLIKDYEDPKLWAALEEIDRKSGAATDRDSAFKRAVMDSMPFPPGVGGRGVADGNSSAQSYEVITAEKAIDESNVGNRMLRSMGWQEGLGLGKDGSGMVEPVQTQSMEKRAGLGSQPKKLDPVLEVQAGDSYRTLIQKKALARFREMS